MYVKKEASAKRQNDFIQSSRGLRITPYGETVRDYAKVILKHASLISSMATHHNGKKFTLATYPSNMITNLLVDFYRHWGREYIVEHQEGSVEEVSNWVASGQTEIGIVYIAQRQLAAFRHILGHKNLEFEPLDVKEACVYVGPNHPYYERDCVDFSELSSLRFIPTPSTFVPMFCSRMAKSAMRMLSLPTSTPFWKTANATLGWR